MQKKVISELYKELAITATTKIAALHWADLWHNQINFLEEQLPFPSPAIFFAFRILGKEDMGQKVQKLKMQVDMYVFFETFSESYQGSWNQGTALEFINIVDDVHGTFHGLSGENFSEMQRIGFQPVDTGSAGNLYLQNFECVCIDYGASPEFEDATIDDLVTSPYIPDPEEDTQVNEKIFIID